MDQSILTIIIYGIICLLQCVVQTVEYFPSCGWIFVLNSWLMRIAEMIMEYETEIGSDRGSTVSQCVDVMLETDIYVHEQFVPRTHLTKHLRHQVCSTHSNCAVDEGKGGLIASYGFVVSCTYALVPATLLRKQPINWRSLCLCI